MHALSNIAWPLVLLGGLGAGIDSLLGSARQEKIKDWLLEKWVRFDDAKLYNFSEKEARNFVSLSDRFFGAKLLSWRRILSAVSVVVACWAYWFAKAYSV